jgi:hypothetical protein
VSQSIVFLVLALVWFGYLALWWRDSRKVSTRRSDRIPTFSRQLSSLGGSAVPRLRGSTLATGFAPRSAAAAAQRRREVIAALAVVAGITLLGALAFGPPLLFTHVVVDLVLAAYAYACVQRRNEAAEREMKVTMLYPDPPAPVIAAAAPAPTPLRRTVNA